MTTEASSGTALVGDTPAPVATPAAAAAPTPAAPGWFFAEGVPGSGEPPAYYKADKYKTLAAQAEAYAGLEPKLGELSAKLKGHAGAPEAYELKPPADFKVPEGVDWTPDPEHPMAKAAFEIGKKHGLTQDVISDLYGAFIQSELSSMPDREALLAEFEPDATKRAHRIGALTSFLKANLGEDEFGQFAESALTTNPSPAAVLRMAERLMALSAPPKAMPDATPTAGREEQVARWKAMQFEQVNGQRRISIDPAFKAQYDALGAKLFPGERREVVNLPSKG